MNPHRVVRNNTPLGIAAVPTADRHGRDVLLGVAKAVYEVAADGSARLAAAPELRARDEMVNPGKPSSIRYPSDIGDEKPGTDVLLVGTAHPPRGRRVTTIDVALRVEARGGTLRKVVRVHGLEVRERALEPARIGRDERQRIAEVWNVVIDHRRRERCYIP